jgi:DNA-binding transcriptional regulator PaaX
MNVQYVKQGKGDLRGSAILSQATHDNVREQLKERQVANIEMETEIFNKEHEKVCVVRTIWNIKNWDVVKSIK